MNILVDTSVWSQVLRQKQNPEAAQRLQAYIQREENIYLMGIILQEILSGITNPKLFKEIKNVLMDFPYLETQKDDYIHAAFLRNQLKNKGVVVHTLDALIAAMAIRHDYWLFTLDQDFQSIARWTSLKLVPSY